MKGAEAFLTKDTSTLSYQPEWNSLFMPTQGSRFEIRLVKIVKAIIL
jgi:hypothetical protein